MPTSPFPASAVDALGGSAAGSCQLMTGRKSRFQSWSSLFGVLCKVE